MGYLQAHLGLLQYQTLQVLTAHDGEFGDLHGLCVGPLHLLGGQSHLPKDGPALDRGQGKLPSIGSLVDAHPPLPEHEQPLGAIFGGVEDLAPLQVNIGKLAVELAYLLLGERLKDVNQGKEADSFFQRRPITFPLLACRQYYIFCTYFGPLTMFISTSKRSGNRSLVTSCLEAL